MHAALAPAQAHSPNEVLLVYNASSPVSTAVAQYYAQKRGITNILAINCQDSAASQSNEVIEFGDYTSQIQTPIANYLAANNGINFIVLAKGVPLVIDAARPAPSRKASLLWICSPRWTATWPRSVTHSQRQRTGLDRGIRGAGGCLD